MKTLDLLEHNQVQLDYVKLLIVDTLEELEDINSFIGEPKTCNEHYLINENIKHINRLNLTLELVDKLLDKQEEEIENICK